MINITCDHEYFIWRCPECGEQIPPDEEHDNYGEFGHDHHSAQLASRWVAAERVRVIVPEEALTAEMRIRASYAYDKSDYASPTNRMRDALLAAGPWARTVYDCARSSAQVAQPCDGCPAAPKPDREKLIEIVATNIGFEMAAANMNGLPHPWAERIVDAILEVL